MRKTSSALIVALAIGAAVAAELEAPAAIRTAAAILLVLVLPGLAVTRLMLPRERGTSVFLLAVTISIAVSVLCGLVLHLTPDGLTLTSWVIALAAITIVAALLSLARRVDDDDVERSGIRVSVTDAIFVALAIAVGVGAMVVARTPVSAKGIDGYSALWMLPGSGGQRRVDVGVESSELRPTRYRLDVVVGKTRLPSYRFALGTGERWTATLRIRPGWRGAVRALLFKRAEPDEIYRRVRLNVDTRRSRARS